MSPSQWIREPVLEWPHEAAQDKGGHREKAIDLTQRAIEEVKAGIEFVDKR
jgi:hypothetical protein